VNRDEIERCIPHRAPFLWLDEVVSVDHQKIHARKFLDPSLDIFSGHYPNFPVLPGVILCEMALQAAAVLMSRLGAAQGGAVPVATRLNNTQFRRMVRPGETVDIDVELTERLASAYFFSGKLSVGSQLAARLEFACTLAPADQNSG
jgi:3-hydroxyacyl-[acyl-carrier-protein] dehydratase